MPIYEYVCEQCGDRTEAIQRLNDPPLQECSKCAGKLRKKVSAPAFQFKGSGWYVTDYGARKGESSEKSSGSSESSSSSSGDDSSAGPVKKAEPKSEPKSETKTETASKSSKD